MKAPLIVNFGSGVDSTCMLIEMVRRGHPAPDFIMFADTGGEKPETIEHCEKFGAWLVAHGYPAVTIARYKPVKAKYDTLEGNCLVNKTLPSLAFGRKSCSLKFKAEPMDKFLKKQPVIRAAWAAGEKPVKFIGYDCGPQDSKRAINRTEDKWFKYRYPLREWGGFDRAACIKVCQEELGYVPVKSACFFCPANKPEELFALAKTHPDLFTRAIAIEDNARVNLKKIEGLWGRTRKKDGRPGSWRAWAENHGLIAPAEGMAFAV